MWELDYKESWALKNWCFWTVVLEKTLESPLDSKEIHLVHPKGNQSWMFTERTDAEVETPILWPPDAKSWFTGKDSEAGKGWRQKEKGLTEDGMVGWHHWLNGHEFEQAPGVGDGQGGLVGCRPWGCKELDTTELLSWTELNLLMHLTSPPYIIVKYKTECCNKPGITLSVLQELTYLVLEVALWTLYYPHSHTTDGACKVQEGQVTCPRSHSG